MTRSAGTHRKSSTDSTRSRARLALVASALSLLILAFGATSASASKQAIAYFGSESGVGSRGGEFRLPGDVAVNSSGAGPADKGDIFVVESHADEGHRIQRFAQNDNGTPANPYDDKYEFVSAWGADVDSTPSGGSDYEVCTVAADCKYGVGSGGNGTAAGNGSLHTPQAIAVDQDSGEVYVADRHNFRVNVYAGDGTFLRSFGYDVVESGPGNAGAGYEICVGAEGDVCKAGLEGSAVGQIAGAGGISVSQPDGNPATGSVFLADPSNNRIDTFDLDGSSPSSFGSVADFGSNGPLQVAVDSRGIVYAARISGGGVDRYDSQGANGGGVGFLAPIPAPPLLGSQAKGLEVDPDSDGAGADTDVLYSLRDLGSGSTVVQQFGPINKPGLTAPPVADDDEHGAVAEFNYVTGLGLDYSSGRLFIGTVYNTGGPYNGGAGNAGVYVLDTAGGAPSASLDSISDLTASSVKVHATVEPNGPPDVSYRLEYSLDGSKWTQLPKVAVGSQEAPQSIEAVLAPPPGGLEPSTPYHVRLSASKPFAPAVVTSELAFTTLAAGPLVETAGAPVRTTTTAQLNGWVTPRNTPTTFHFEYGDQGPCESNPCTATATESAGSGNATQLVSAEIEGLQPATTYHYRVVGDNGISSSGEDMTVVTRATEAPLSHGRFAGPPGSDRAYEQVGLPETSGNPVYNTLGFAPDGNRAVYAIGGGTPISETGSFQGFYFAERGASGWQNKSIMPPRSQLAGPIWGSPHGPSDLSSMLVWNFDGGTEEGAAWRLSPGGSPSRVFGYAPPNGSGSLLDPFLSAPESSLVLAGLVGEHDPAHPGAAAHYNYYDVSSGTPKLASFLPGNALTTCNVAPAGFDSVADDGSYFVFDIADEPAAAGCSDKRLYLRDLKAETTERLAPQPVSGTDCGEELLIGVYPQAVYFSAKSRLVAEDTAPASCSGKSASDVYRYGLGDKSLECVTCLNNGLDADVSAFANQKGGLRVALAEDESRLYFGSVSPDPLVPGAVAADTFAGSTYVLDLKSGELRWVGADIEIDSPRLSTPGGSVALFDSADPSFNPLGDASDNGGKSQVYRYDDRDRSLVCVSCPQDGSPAPVAAGSGIQSSKDGSDVAFETPLALVAADQNTPGPGHAPVGGGDVYEWRDGRLLLITDGLTDWPAEPPRVQKVSASGNDVFFIAPIQYTPDALDAYQRLYDARIGGGFDFPRPPKPCPLEVCQGTPKGAPEEQAPGTGSFAGPSDPPKARRCPKGKRKVRSGAKVRCVGKRHSHKRAANHNRRASR